MLRIQDGAVAEAAPTGKQPGFERATVHEQRRLRLAALPRQELHQAW
jgi:hypothetical protein